MKVIFRFVILSAVIFLLFSTSRAIRVNISSGEIFIGGAAYQTPNYQNYLRFYLVGETRMPKRNYTMAAEQLNAVYLDHPVQPGGEYEYKVGMPYHASEFSVNENLYFPVWYVGCAWKITASVQTPEVTPDSPQFIIVSAPFTMNGSSNFYGAYSTGFRLRGRGTAEIKFEKSGTKYFVREARYIFTAQNSFAQTAK